MQPDVANRAVSSLVTFSYIFCGEEQAGEAQVNLRHYQLAPSAGNRALVQRVT